jgi:hypothetical protein
MPVGRVSTLNDGTGATRERTGGKELCPGWLLTSTGQNLISRDGHAPAAPRAVGYLCNHWQTAKLQQQFP